MSYSDKQWAFLKDVGRLIAFIDEIGWKATGGDLLRSEAEQNRKFKAGLSRAKGGESRHQFKMAIDLNLWDEHGIYIPHLELEPEQLKDKLAIVAEYWLDLHPKNKWGGAWAFFDPYHFERGE